MPTRPSPRRVPSKKISAPVAVSSAPASRPSLGYVHAHVTMLWVVVIGLGVALWTIVFLMLFRIEQLERLAYTNSSVPAQSLDDAKIPTAVEPPVVAPSSAEVAPTVESVLWKAVGSPDGKKVAGYDVTTLGKMGLSVTVNGEDRIRHLVILDPRSESSGKETPFADEMKVVWLSDSKIQYDYLVKENGAWTKKVDTATIGF